MSRPGAGTGSGTGTGVDEDPQRYASVALLVELVTNTLDPGYAAAAARRGPTARRRWYERPAVALTCAAIGFLLVVAYVHTHRGAPAAAQVHADLVQKVRAAQQHNDDLDQQAHQLATQLDQVRGGALSAAQRAQLATAELVAGQLAATGPGLSVTLGEPPAASASPTDQRGGTVPITSTNILSDRDVRSVVNELWNDGAEAISVNDVRLTPSSAIRFAGQAVLVDFAPITPPYVIRAIGNATQLDTRFALSDVASRYQTLASAEGISFDFTEKDSLSLPASAPVTLRYARPATPAPSPSGSSR